MRLILAITLAASTAAAHAQGSIMGTGVLGSAASLHQPNNPYTLIVEYKSVRTLADGTHITNLRKEFVYRDTLGRTRTGSESPMTGAVPGTYVNATITDTVANKIIAWAENSNTTTHQYTVRDMPAPRVPPTTYGNQPNGNGLLRDAQQPGRPNTPPRIVPPPVNVLRPQVTTESLGTRDIMGFSCEATRTTTTYPVDFFGNDRPLVVTSENCYSKEIQHQLDMKSEDPRNGTQTMTVVTLTRGEPDPALFQPPAGYIEHVLVPPRPIP